MAKLSVDELLAAFEQMTVLEPVRVQEGLRGQVRRHRRRPGRGRRRLRRPGSRPGSRRGGADRVLRRPDRGRPEQDPGYQGRPRADRPWPQGGQGPRRCRPQAGQGGRRQGRGREDQGRARGPGRQGRDQVGSCPTCDGGASPAPSSARTRRRSTSSRRLRPALPVLCATPDERWPLGRRSYGHVPGLTSSTIAVSYSFCERGRSLFLPLRQGVVLHAVRPVPRHDSLRSSDLCPDPRGH